MPLERDRIAHYNVVRILGAGAMGEVYEAFDEHLQRRVAIKVISPGGSGQSTMRQRFLREAHAASSLSHPNVAHVYDVGSDGGIDYIAMEYIDGQTLSERMSRGAMSIDDIVDVALQLADALAAAHERGVVHRDIKPSNVMITTRGQVKMLDFGLARIDAAPAAHTDETLDQATGTNPGTILGTTSYMSPEQALGEPAAAASDVFSVGVVLYEMIAGRLPFAGKTAADTLHRITGREPEPLARFNYDLPVELERIVRKCLEKTASRRYHSAGELLVDLKSLSRDRSSGARLAPRWAAPARPRRSWLLAVVLLVTAVVLLGGWELLRRKTIAPVPADRAIAVLPFTVPGGNSTEYIADGITESLINALAEEPHIRVLARSTVFRFKGSKLTPQEVGRTLGVDAVFVAGMQQEGDMVNVSAELVSARDGAHLWGDRYTRKATDLIVIQDDLARGLAQALQLDHMPRELAAVGELRERAHALYLRGEHELNARNLRAASDYFHRASVADPSYALPYAGTADALTLSARYAAAPVAEFAPAARQAARKALALDPSSPEAHVSLASVYDTCDWEFAKAEREYQTAITLRPGDVLAHQWHALLLARLGRIADAVAERQRALALDPYSPVLHLFAANIDYYAGRYDSAAAFCAEAIALEPRLPFAHVQMALIRLQQHRYADAQNELGLDAGRPSAPSIATRAVLDALEGDPAAAAKSLDMLPAGEADYARAVVNATVGRIDDALDSLQRAFAERSVYASYAAVEPLLEPLHAHPRFAALVRDAGLRRR